VTRPPSADEPEPGRSFAVSDAVRVALAPGPAYAALVAADATGSWWRVAGAVVFCAVLAGSAATIAATETISAPTVLSVSLCWSFVSGVQLLAALVLIRGASGAPVRRPRALELLFRAHLPWSLWLLAVAGAASLLPRSPLLFPGAIHSMLVPAVWTPILIAAFCRRALGCSAREARRRTLLHQALTWLVIAAFALAMTTPWARMEGGIQ
jgi:hypothetical protein